jgi:hypothetical protein
VKKFIQIWQIKMRENLPCDDSGLAKFNVGHK